jgi:LysM repeat protein
MRRTLVIFLLSVAALGSYAAPAAELGVHKVREGETLAAIGKRYGVSIAELATFNKLGNANNLVVGQLIHIPLKSSPAAAPTAAPAAAPAPAPAQPAAVSTAPKYGMPAEVKASLDKMRVIPGKWRYIVIHHSASTSGTPKGMDAYHRNVRHMENGLAYHFVIGNGNGMADGSLFVGNRWRQQLDGGHLASESLNAKSIGICLVGDFSDARPTPRQMQTLYSLISYLRGRCKLPVSAVKLHRQINTKPTECPGDNFPAKAFFSGL